jgi:hypothetical protein
MSLLNASTASPGSHAVKWNPQHQTSSVLCAKQSAAARYSIMSLQSVGEQFLVLLLLPQAGDGV